MDSSNGLSSALVGGADTIVARATATGRGALAMIRVSGPATEAIAKAVCPAADFDRGWRASMAAIHGAGGEVLDHAVIVAFPGPRSYTGEDMLELTVHGSSYLVEKVMEACVAAGARYAEPGEFTRRAVANGKLDLVQAEAIADLVAAETAWQLRNAREQLTGVLSQRFSALRAELVALAALVDASLEFEAQAIEVGEGEIRKQARRCLDLMSDLIGTAGAGQRIRDGLRVAILGATNSGKSTLFNYLSGSERAIVSPQPGTTRDVLEVELEIGGVRMVLQDTAGFRAGGDEVEEEGQRRAIGAATASDLVIMLWAVDGPKAPETPAGVPVIRLRSKADLGDGDCDGWLSVSCYNGQGLKELRSRLAAAAQVGVADLGGAVAVAARHRAALERARKAIENSDLETPELVAEDVREALGAIENLLGEVDDEAVLDEVFGSFCIGK